LSDRASNHEHGARCPALVVVPPGLLRNWQQELEKWAPQLSFYVYHGTQRSLPPRKGADYSVFLTTYHTVRNDCVRLADVDLVIFSCMVIDEAQCIKNHNTMMTMAVKEVGNVSATLCLSLREGHIALPSKDNTISTSKSIWSSRLPLMKWM